MTTNLLSTSQASPVRLSRGYKVSWGVASLGTQLIAGVYAALLPIFHQDCLGLQARWIGIASLVHAIWNAVNDPLFGYITESTRSRLGRRIPYMRFTAPFLALTFIMVWFAPAGGGSVRSSGGCWAPCCCTIHVTRSSVLSTRPSCPR